MDFTRNPAAGRHACLALGLLALAGCTQVARKAPLAAAATPATTGIPACDAYLDRYLACHRTAGIYPPDTLDSHYQAMRDTLLHDASDPRVRPYLTYRCMGLTRQLDAALKGRACTAAPTPDAQPSSH